MNFYAASSHATELIHEMTQFARGRYPSFVTSPWPANPSTIPVFSLHDVFPESFERRLAYLAENGYRTIGADEYVDRVGKTRGDRVVMLTFDDGRDSLWTVAYPYLKKYGMTAVAFVLPGETPEAPEPRPFFDGSGGGSPFAHELCSWAELAAMAPVIDVQSHSATHFIMFASERVVDFFSPRIRDRWMNIEWPVMNGIDRPPPLGAPIYDMDSRLSDTPRLMESGAVRNACAAVVAEGGGEEFFRRPDWKKALMEAHEKAVSAADAPFKRESPEEQAAAVREAVTDSKTTIESRLGKKVAHLCLPFGIGGRIAIKAAAEAGYRSVHWGVSAEPWADSVVEITSVTRIKDDYLPRLPGRGRAPLLSIFGGKAVRRLAFGLKGKGRLR